MTIKACNTRFIVGGVDLSGDTNTVGVTIAGRTLEYGVLQDCDQRKLALSPNASIEQNGYFTGNDATQLEGVSWANLGSTTGVHVGVIFDTAGTVPFGFVQSKGYNSSQSIPAAAGALITLSTKWPTLSASGAQLYHGYQVAAASVTATGAVTGIDMGAAGAAGGKAFVFVTSITGSATNATIKIQSDTDPAHGTTSDEGTATFSAVGCQEVTLSGTVNRYVRANVGSLGSATGFTFYVVVALSGVTY